MSAMALRRLRQGLGSKSKSNNAAPAPWTRTGATLAAIGVVLLLAGCSTANYAPPVDTFAQASGEAEDALVTLNDSVTEGYANYVRSLASNGDGLVEIADGDCLVSSERCRLMVFVRADGSEKQLAPDAALANMLAVMTGIRTYADNLTLIVTADTAEAASANVNATIGSVQNLATIVAEQLGGSGAVVPDIAAPASAAANWLLGQYVESVKLNGLRHATATAQPVVAEAAGLFEQAGDVAAVLPKALLAADVQRRLDVYRQSSSEADLDRLIVAADAYDSFLVAKPSQVFARLREAHDALADSLNNEDLTLAAAMAKIEVFAAEATAFAKIMKDLSSALASTPAGGDQ